jgi:hypothetical protein
LNPPNSPLRPRLQEALKEATYRKWFGEAAGAALDDEVRWRRGVRRTAADEQVADQLLW